MIGEKIYRIRKQKKLSLSELADRANISKSYLSNIERNVNRNPSIHIMEKIAAVLDIEVSSLLVENKEYQGLIDQEWIEFVNELKASGVEKEELPEYKMVIEFVKWKNKHGNRGMPNE